MNRYTIFLFLSLFIRLLSFGQKFDVNNYKPIQSSEELPLDFRVKSEQKYIEDKAELSKKEKRFTRKSQEKFLLQSNFMLDNLLQSGRILYNDPLSKYVKVGSKNSFFLFRFKKITEPIKRFS
ncbi:MAG: hypothetical protein K9J13_17395 [Saprospiraceae bacterium]|nr:hypothetical protein [Saprospiraceae bacterium]